MRRLIFAFLLLVSSHSFGAVYEWTLGWNNQKYSSPGSACDVFNSAMLKNYSVGVPSLFRSSDVSFSCVIKSPQGGIVYSSNVSRFGDSCPSPQHTYNAQTGECVLPPDPPQDCSNVSPGIFKSPNGPIGTSEGRRYVATRLQGQVCYNGCWYEIADRASSCFAVPGSSDTGYCNYIGTGNGSSCTLPDAELGRPGDSLNPTPPTNPGEPPSDPNDPGCPAGYSWSGTTCVKTPDPDNPNPGGDGGGNDGGSSGGNSGGNNGGNSGGNGGNNGGNGGDSGDGSGNGNTGGGTGGGNGSGTGNGNGNGNGSGEGEGGAGPGGPGGGGVPGVCEEGVCEFVPPEAFGEDPVPSFGESLQSVYKGIQDSPIGQSIQQITFPTGGSCPAGNVRLDALKVTLTFDSHCDLWAQVAPILAAVMLAVWALLAVRVFLSA